MSRCAIAILKKVIFSAFGDLFKFESSPFFYYKGIRWTSNSKVVGSNPISFFKIRAQKKLLL